MRYPTQKTRTQNQGVRGKISIIKTHTCSLREHTNQAMYTQKCMCTHTRAHTHFYSIQFPFHVCSHGTVCPWACKWLSLCKCMQIRSNHLRIKGGKGKKNSTQRLNERNEREKGIREQSFWVAGGCKLGKRSVENNRGYLLSFCQWLNF